MKFSVLQSSLIREDSAFLGQRRNLSVSPLVLSITEPQADDVGSYYLVAPELRSNNLTACGGDVKETSISGFTTISEVETKSSGWWDDLRHQEGAKIKCGEKHFEAIRVADNPAKFIKATTVDDVLGHI